MRVEPGERVFAIAPLNVTRAVRADERLRAATIRAGKRVVVTGVLGRGFDPSLPGQGYRDAGTGLVLTPPPRGSMLVSTDSIEALVASQRERARVHRRQVWLASTVLLLGHALMLWRYDVLALGGRTIRATVVDGRTDLAPRGDQWRPRYFLRAVSDERVTGSRAGRTLEAEVDAGTYYRTRYELRPQSGLAWAWRSSPRIRREYFESAPDLAYRSEYDVESPRDSVPVWWRTADGTNEIGARATVHAGSAFAMTLLAGLLLFTYALAARSARPWWERKRIEDRVAG